MNNVLVLTYWSYSDALIQTYTLPYVRIIKKNLPPGSSIYLFTLEKSEIALKKSKRDSVGALLKKEGIYWLPFVYKPFGLYAFFSWVVICLNLCLLVCRRKITTIHCWCTPAGGIGYFLSLLLNRRLILDSYEPHAETMIENGTWRKDGLAFRLLFWLEKKQTQRATDIISATMGMYDYALKKYNVNIPNFYVKPACVDLRLFSKKNLKDKQLLSQLGLLDNIVCVYAGKFGGIYLEKEVFDFFKVAADFWGSKFRVLLLTSHPREEIVAYCKQAKLTTNIVTSLFVEHQQVPHYLGLGDFAITPVKPVPTKKYCTPIKDGEYWALGLPIIIPANISDDSKIVEENYVGAILRHLDQNAYRQAVIEIDRIIQRPREENFQKIRSIAEQYRSFDIAERIYKKVYPKLS